MFEYQKQNKNKKRPAYKPIYHTQTPFRQCKKKV